jgi:hypothetical protein
MNCESVWHLQCILSMLNNLLLLLSRSAVVWNGLSGTDVSIFGSDVVVTSGIESVLRWI